MSISPNNAAITELQKGNTILLTNIITGYQKIFRTAISPYRQMVSAFDRDCIEAEEIFIVGYSYGDEHINDIVRNARKYNNRCKIYFINPTTDESKVMFDFLLHWGVPKQGIYQNDGNDTLVAKDFNVTIIKKKFGDFLNTQ